MKIKFLIIAIFVLLFIQSAYSQLVGPVISLTGNIFNEVTRQPVTVFLIVLDEEGKRVNATRSNSAQNGYYYLTGLKPGKKYTLTIKQKDFLTEEFEIITPNTDKYLEISRDFLLKPLEVGVSIKLPVAPFELNKSKLRYGAELFLDDYAHVLKLNPNVKIQIECFPDNNDNKQENIKLTEERANSLKAYFESQGIESSRMTTKSNSNIDPKTPLPTKKLAKGKRYIGPTYLIITAI